MYRAFVVGVISLLVAAALASAQPMQPGAGDAVHRAEQPYDIESFGIFRQVILLGDFSPKVGLGEVMAKRPSTGVGTLSEARGEISIFDGKLIVSYGKPGTHPALAAETSALLATGKATAWQSVAVARDVAPPDVESFIAETARAHGIDPDKSFPFELRGAIGPYAMHVNAAPTNGPHGMGMPIAVTVQHEGDEIAGAVAGIYASRALVSVVTHGIERTHAHWVSADGTSTAHLDSWGIKAGAALLLPKT